MHFLRRLCWSICLLAAVIACWRLGQVQALDSEGTLRVILYGTLFICHIGLVFLWPFRGSSVLPIFITAILLRLLLIPAPVSDDVHRYLWEGKITAEGINPYTDIADADVFTPTRDHHWELMNHKERLTAYPPGIELIFAGLSSIYYHPITFKVGFILADLLTLLLIVQLLRHRKQPIRLAGFYAFSPVVLLATAGEAHFDSVFVLGLVAFWLAAETKRPALAWLALAFSAHVKFFSILLAPLYFKRDTARTAWIFPLSVILVSIPFAGQLPNLWRGLIGFATGGQFNGFIHHIVKGISNSSTADSVSALAFATIGLFIWTRTLKGLPIVQASLWVFGAFLLLSPIFHFWYLLWILPVFCLRTSLSWLVLSGTMGLYFLVWNQAEWGLPSWAWPVIWLPFAVTGAAELVRGLRRLRNRELFHPPLSASVVIPTLNAADSLQRAIDSTAGAEKVVIADASSQDTTVDIARENGLSVVTSLPGRGEQIAAGIDATTSDLVIILHADAQLPPDSIPLAIQYFTRHSSAAHAALGQRFDRAAPLGLLVEILNEMRVVLNGTTFGDQVQVFRRAALEKVGGFPTQPLMEDVEASLRTLPVSMTGYLGYECTVSGGKWRTQSPLKRFRMVIELVAKYRLARMRSQEKAADLTRTLYQRYYGGGN